MRRVWRAATCVEGCTDPVACTDPAAVVDDGSCEELDECGVRRSRHRGSPAIARATLKTNGGICGGPGIEDPFCDCDGNVEDECGVCGGDGSTRGRLHDPAAATLI